MPVWDPWIPGDTKPSPIIQRWQRVACLTYFQSRTMCLQRHWVGVTFILFYFLYFFSGRFKSLCVSAHQLNCQRRRRSAPRKSFYALAAVAGIHSSLFVRLPSNPTPSIHPSIRSIPSPPTLAKCAPNCYALYVNHVRCGSGKKRRGDFGEGLLGSVVLWPSSLAKWADM